jgi:hypothetical protein
MAKKKSNSIKEDGIGKKEGGKTVSFTVAFLIALICLTAGVFAVHFYHRDRIRRGRIQQGLLLVVVKDMNGRRLEGATVSVYDSDGNFITSGATESYGRYAKVFTKTLPWGKYYVVAEKDGLTAESKVFNLRVFKRRTLKLQPIEPENCVEITVVHLPDETPVPDAIVEIVDDIWYGNTDDDGKASIECGILSPDTTYSIVGSEAVNGWLGMGIFTTDSEGRASYTLGIDGYA